MNIRKAIVFGTLAAASAGALLWILSHEASVKREITDAELENPADVGLTDAGTSPVGVDNHAGNVWAPDSVRTSLEQKLHQKEVNALQNTGLTAEELNAVRYGVFKSFYDRESSPQIMAEFYEKVASHVGTREADFQFAIINAAGDWEEIKRMVRQREAELDAPHAYDALLLETGINSGAISAEEVEALVRKGNATLPDDIVFRMASNGNIDAIEGLSRKGLLGNVNYEHPTLSMNATASE